MKYSGYLLLVTMLIVAVAGCKKDDDDFNKKIEEVYLKKEFLLSSDDEVLFEMVYDYDASGRFLGIGGNQFKYNEDGKLTSIGWGPDKIIITYEGMGRISKITYSGYIWMELVLFYGAGSKPVYAILNNWHFIKYKYGEDGHIISKEHSKLGDGEHLYTEELTWKDGNLMKLKDVLSTVVFTYDSNPSYAKAKHLPAEYLLSIELLGFNSMEKIGEITENNMISHTFGTYVYENKITEYSTETGLPLRIERGGNKVVYVYGER